MKTAVSVSHGKGPKNNAYALCVQGEKPHLEL